jgi:hypothetical protein
MLLAGCAVWSFMVNFILSAQKFPFHRYRLVVVLLHVAPVMIIAAIASAAAFSHVIKLRLRDSGSCSASKSE